MGKPIDLVIFDCDGVLVDSEILAARVLARELTAQGVPISAEQCLDRFTGISMAAVLAMIEETSGVALPEGFEQRVRAADFAAFAAELTPVAGVREMLEALPFRRCVASSGALAKMRFSLGLTGLLPMFEPHLFSAEMVSRGKPAPDLFLFAAAAMGTLPAAAVVVEDSVAGVTAATAAGMRALGFAGGLHCGSGYAAMLRAAGAGVVFRRMADLPAILAEVCAG